jgi:hypothetical protein
MFHRRAAPTRLHGGCRTIRFRRLSALFSRSDEMISSARASISSEIMFSRVK